MLNGTKTVIKHKIGLLNLAEGLGNVSKGCRIMVRFKFTIQEKKGCGLYCCAGFQDVALSNGRLIRCVAERHYHR